MSAFVKDEWKATDRLTLNLGLRWEYYGPPYDANGLMIGLEGGSGALFGISGRDFSGWMAPGARADLTRFVLTGPGTARPDQRSQPRDLNNFGPAAGFAVQIPWLGERRAIVRGGYQITFLGSGKAGAVYRAYGNPPGSTFLSMNYVDVEDPYLDLTDLAALLPLDPPVAPLETIPIETPVDGIAVGVFSPDYVSPYVQNLTLSFTHAVIPQLSIDLRYFGTLSRKLDRAIDLNVPNFLHNGLVDAFDAARAGGEHPLLWQIFDGIDMGMGTIDGVTADPSAPATPGRFMRGPSTLRRPLARGDYRSLATVLGFLNYREAFNPTLPPLLPGERGSVIRTNMPANFIITNPQFGSARMRVNAGYGNYHALEGRVALRASRGLSFGASYVWSKNLANPGSGRWLDPTDREEDYTLANGHREHQVKTYGTLRLPLWPGEAFINTRGLWARLAEGWTMSWITTLSSGRPLTVGGARTLYLDGSVDQVGPFDLMAGTPTWEDGAAQGNFWSHRFVKVQDPQCEDPAVIDPGIARFCRLNAIANASTGEIVFRNPLPGERGDFGLNRFFAPSRWTADMAISKHFRIGEARAFEVRIEASNIFNHPTPTNPNTDLNNSMEFGAITNKTGQRTWQAKLRLDF